MKFIGKKVIYLLSIFVVLSFVSCSKSNTSDAPPPADTGSIVGAWELVTGVDPLDVVVVYFNETDYFFAQHALGADGHIGGIQVGEKGAAPDINTSKGDSANGADFNYTSATPNTIVIAPDVNITRIVPDGLTGAWVTDPVISGANYAFSVLIFNGDGTYLVAVANSARGMEIYTVPDDGSGGVDEYRDNATEYGTYTYTATGLSLTPDLPTDNALLTSLDNPFPCTDNEPEAVCGTVAGDSNIYSGFTDADHGATLEATYVISGTDLIITDTIPDDPQNPSFTLHRVAAGLNFTLP